MFFNSLSDLLRVLVVGTLAYAGLVLLLRVTGKRTLSKMNAFDMVVTVALGSTLATTLLSKEVALAEGLTAFALLILLQYAITWSSVRWPLFQRIVKARPRLLAYDGETLDDALREERVSEEELAAAVRDAGLPSVEQAQAVVLETEGTLTVVPMQDGAEYHALRHVRGRPDEGGEDREDRERRPDRQEEPRG